MDEANAAMLGRALAALPFFLFLAVWVSAVLWARTREKLAIQETLRKLIDKGSELTPEVIDALRRPKPRRTPDEVRAYALKFRYWGVFLLVLGIALALFGLRFADSPVKDLRDITGSAIMVFVLPGLFCLVHSFIQHRIYGARGD